MSGQALIDHDLLLEVLAAEGELLASAASAASLDAPVPTTPGWTIGETVRHVGSKYRVVLAWIATGQRPKDWQRDPAPGQSVEEYLREGLALLTGELAAHDPAEPAASWWPADRTYGFWRRRMAHETTIHRIDVQGAAFVPATDVADGVAVDGIDEALALWLAQKLPMLGLSGTREGAVAIVSGGHHWIARVSPTETTAWRCSAEEAQRAGARVVGPPMQVYLWLWGRAGPMSVRVEGEDEDAVGQLWALLRLATK
jgi:uncharacterized protein (TIGR03083 family)